MDTSSNDVTGNEILQHLKSIESRISKIETYLDLPIAKSEEDIEEEPIIPKTKAETDEELEFRIGQFWFAKLGIFAFVAGWIIGNTLPFGDLNQIIPVAIGFVTGIVVIATSIFIKKRFPHLSGWVLGSGFVIRLRFRRLSRVFQQNRPVLAVRALFSRRPLRPESRRS